MAFDPLSLVFPRLTFRALVRMFAAMIAGALVAGLYGVLHDQVTYSISEEYFTRFKFLQFASADPGAGPPRLFVGIIGFHATWWVGAIAAWVLARVSISGEGTLAPPGKLAAGFAVVLVTAAIAGLVGWCWGRWRIETGYAESWLRWMESLGVTRPGEFMTVGYIHNASYLGGVIGTVLGSVLLVVWKKRAAGKEAGPRRSRGRRG